MIGLVDCQPFSFPMYFKLTLPNLDIIKPSESIEKYGKVVLNFLESDEAICLEDDGEVNWLGFKSKYDLYAYADAEAEQLLAHLPDDQNELIDQINTDCSCNLKELLTTVRNIIAHNGEGDTIICHRRPSSFWPILFRQNIDLLKVTRVIWAGETCVDEGGPFREFLLHAMENLHLLSSHFFGDKYSLLFAASPEAVMKKQYFMLGQLSALSIVLIGRGPHCFNGDLVRYLFTRELPNKVVENVENGELSYNMSKIKDCDTSCLIEANIVPSSSVEQNMSMYSQFFCLLSRTSAIDQFYMGIRSIYPELAENSCCLKQFFLKDTVELSLMQVRSVIEFKREAPPGSNLSAQEESAMIEIELFLADLEKGDCGVTLKDFLKFTAATDRIPITGLHKNIEVHFVESSCLPWSSTCGLILFVPRSVTREKLIYALKEGIGFGSL